MSAGQWAAFVCYALAALLSLVFGALYLVRSQFMPYHQEAVGMPWQQLDPRFQALLLGLLRVAGGGFLTAGISVGILLILPYRGAEAWSRYAIPVIGLASGVPALYATILIRARAGARTPVAASAAAIGLIVTGFILSLF
jgi:hypothetical protein